MKIKRIKFLSVDKTDVVLYAAHDDNDIIEILYYVNTSGQKNEYRDCIMRININDDIDEIAHDSKINLESIYPNYAKIDKSPKPEIFQDVMIGLVNAKISGNDIMLVIKESDNITHLVKF